MDSASQLTRTQLQACVEMGQALTAELDPNRLLTVVLDKVSGLVPAGNWSLLILDEASDELYFALSVDLDQEVVAGLRLKPGQGVAGQALSERRPVVVADVAQSPHFHPEVDKLTGFVTRSLIAVPLIFQGRALGVLEAVNPQRLDEAALALMNVIADFVAIAVENTRRFQRMHELSIKDDLTGLYNTRHLYGALQELAQGRGAIFSLVFMDIDNFKRVVDTHGHLNGSRALMQVAGTIRQVLIPPAFGVAYGGDEFVLVLPGQRRAQALETAQAVRRAMAATSYLADQGLNVGLAASFGVASFPEDAADLSSLLSRADQAMFGVKRGGKDGVAAGQCRKEDP